MHKFEFGGYPGKVLGGKIRQLVEARKAEGASDQGPADQDKERHRAAALAKLTGKDLGSSPADETTVDMKRMRRRGAGNFADLVREQKGDDGDADKKARRQRIADRRQTPMYQTGTAELLDVVVNTKTGQKPRKIEIVGKAGLNHAGQTSPQTRQYRERNRGGGRVS